MSFNLKRPYKHDTPLNTVTKIRTILSDLNCLCYETKWNSPYNEIHSVRIETDDENGLFGTNGKGQTRLYALASAYGEFMERLQNKLFPGLVFPRVFLNQIREESGFYYFPDERFLSKEEFDELPEEFLNDVFGNKKLLKSSEAFFARLEDNGYPGCIAVPWYDVRNKKEIYLPYNLMTWLLGSNGMSAGNDIFEGIFQGICEIFERYGASQVYYKHLTPPTVPESFLKKFPDEYRLIKEIEKEPNFEIIVKDFSACKRLPCVGVIIKDKSHNKYRLNIGSDTFFAVALKRCLTEIYQGIGDNKGIRMLMHDIPQTEHDFFLNNNQESLSKRDQNFTNFIKDGSGVFPYSLFLERESYTFDHTVFESSDSYEAEVKHLVKLVLDAGHNIYVRDVSYLGFPSFIIYIPGMSSCGRKVSSTNGRIELSSAIRLDQAEDLFFSFLDLDDQSVERLASILDTRKDEEMKMILNLEFIEASDWHTIPKSFFLTLMWLKLDQFENAIRNLRLFIQTTNNQENGYYQTILEYLQLRSNGKTSDTVEKLLIDRGYDEDVVKEVIETFTDKAKLFDGIQIPECPNCNICALQEECLSKKKKDFMITINNSLKNKVILQERQFGFLKDLY